MTRPLSEAVHLAASDHYRAGHGLLPVAIDGSKRPAVERWTQFQTERPSREQMVQWFGRTPEQCRQQGFSLLCGEVSGGLHVLDAESYLAWHSFQRTMTQSGDAQLLQRLTDGYLEGCPKGGRHLPRYCENVLPSQPLARRLKTPDEQKHEHDRVMMLVELRGEGGLCIAAPSGGSVHPTGKRWNLLSGAAGTIVRITPEEQEVVLTAARSLDRMPVPEPRREPQQRPADGDRPGDIFNAQASWADVLGDAGWEFVSQRGGEQFWRRPGAQTNGIDATTNYNNSRLLYVFSTSTTFEALRGYSKFSAYALLNHHGDFEAAARDLASKGYERPTRSTRRMLA